MGINYNVAIALYLIAEKGQEWQQSYKELLDDIFAEGKREFFRDEFMYVSLAQWVLANVIVESYYG